MDPAIVALTVSSCKVLKSSATKGFSFTVSATEVWNVLKFIGGEVLFISFLEDHKIMLGSDFGRVTISCAESVDNKSKIPSLNYHVKSRVCFEDFKSFIKLCDYLDTSVTFKTKARTSLILAGELCESKAFPVVEHKTVGNGVEETGKYSVEYLIKILKSFSKKEDLTLEFSTDKPLKVTGEDGSYVILAPRVDND